jgi:hypothetical protein
MHIAIPAGIAQHSLMKRQTSRLAALVLALAAVAWTPARTFADERVRVEGTVSVFFVYPSAVNYCNPAGGNVSVEAQGLGNMEGLGSVFLTVKKCFTFSDGSYAGTFALTAGNGDTLTGTYAGTQQDADETGFGPFKGTLIVTRGTGGFRRVRGTLTFIAVGTPTSVGVTAPTANGMAFYMVKGNIVFPENR